MRGIVRLLPLFACLFGLATAVWAIDVGSDGSDGALIVPGGANIDLGLATTGSWNSPGNGHGVYDPDKWAVVFKYSSVDVNTVTFTNHPSGAPVVWLVQGNATINGAIFLDGVAGDNQPGYFILPGPGGFRGGPGRLNNSSGSAGLGPGGGLYLQDNGGAGGSYGTSGGAGGNTYGNARVLPLIGGSGGAGSGSNGCSGGAGGGAILIACGGTLTLTSGVQIYARGGYSSSGGGGAGGGIRLVADTITGSANGLYATSGRTDGRYAGGMGRIRIEGNNVGLAGMSAPAYTMLTPLEDGGTLAQIWPPAGSPTLRVLTVGGQAVPADPRARFVTPGDLALSSGDSLEAIVEAKDMPVTWTVKVALNRRIGQQSIVTATYVDGDSVSSHWRAMLPPFPVNDFVDIQARANQ